MPVYKGSQKIDDIYFGNKKINYIYKGSTLVYASSVPDTNYVKKPNYSSIVSRSNNTVYQAANDIWLNITYNVNANPCVYVSKYPNMSNQVTVAYGTASGVSTCKGGCIIYIPKGVYYKGVNTGGLREIATVPNTGKLAYKYKDKVAKIPNYFTYVSLAQNAVATARTKPCWLYSYGSTRIVQVSKDNYNWITIAGGVVSASVEPSALFYIPAGYYFKTTGTSNVIFECME